VDELVRNGTAVLAHIRPDSPSRARFEETFSRKGVEVLACEWSAEALHKALSAFTPTTVFSLLGTTAAQAKRLDITPAQAYDRIDVGLTLMLFNAVQQVNPLTRFMYLSSLGAGKPWGAYLQARHRVERAIIESDASYTIVRPSLITGPDRDESRLTERIGAAVGDTTLSLFRVLGAKRTAQRYRSQSGEHLARAMVRLARDPNTNRSIVESEALWQS